MARLTFEIAGDNSGLANAANQSIGILESLQNVADGLKIDLFKVGTVDDINNIGAALTRVTGNIKDYINTAVKGSQAWQDQSAATTLDQLSSKILALNGNAQLFGTSIKSQQAEINAYQAAITRLLSAGLDPTDARIQSLKANIDSLTASINQQNAAVAQSKFAASFQDTGALILDAQRKVERLQTALQNATNERSIVQYNQRLIEAQANLERLRALGTNAAQATQAIGAQGTRLAGSFNQVGIEFGRVIQDLPYAANNFGAVGNNITRIVEVLPGYLAQTSAVIVANGGVATSANVAKAALAGLFTGFGGISLAVSAAVAGFVIYQQVQQANARAAAAHTDAIQKQKKALDDYIGTLGVVSKAEADAASGYGQEVAKLDQLFGAIQDNTHARYDNGTAIQELQKAYPDVFGSLKENEFLTLKAASAYEKLRDGIISSAIAASATKLAGKATDDYVTNTIALAGAQDRVVTSQQKYNAALDAYNKLRFGPGGSSAGGNGNAALDEASSAAANAKTQLEAAKNSVIDYRIEIFKAQQAIGNYNKVATDAFAKNKQPQKSGILLNLENELKRLQDIRPTIKVQAELDLNTSEIKKVQDQIDKLGGAKGTKKPKTDTSAQNQISIEDQLRNLTQRSAGAADTNSLSGNYEDQKKKIEAIYEDLAGDLSTIEAKITANTKISSDQRTADLAKAAEIRKTLEVNENNALYDLAVLNQQHTADEVQRIRDVSDVKSTESRAKELNAIQAWYDAEVVKAKNNEVILAAIRDGRTAQIKAVNDKYETIEADLYFKIGQIEDQAQAGSEGKDASRTQQIENEWEKRRKAANDYYDKLIKLNASANSDSTVPSVAQGMQGINADRLKSAQGTTNKKIDKGESTDITNELNKQFTQGLERGVKSFADNFYNTLTGINQQADQSFGAIFNSITSELTTSLNSIFLDVVTDGLTKSLKKGIEDGTSGMSKALVGAAAAASLAGGLISGITPKTSSLGQAAGGALSGAASGAVLGTALGPGGTLVGGVVGGLVGAVGGLFGSKKARKEAEKLQQQQLDEAKKQTELLRQQALAYTSSIIGKQTTNGIITGVDINAFGELTAKVSGKDLQFVLDRNSNSRG